MDVKRGHYCHYPAKPHAISGARIEYRVSLRGVENKMSVDESSKPGPKPIEECPSLINV